MWFSPSHFRYLCRAAVVVAACCAVLPARAQEASQASAQDKPAKTAAAKPAKPPKPYGGGSPLDVILHNKLWETPPPSKPFVVESRKPVDTLKYQPTAKLTDPARPKLLSRDQLKSLEGELEEAGAHNEKVGGVKNRNFTDVALAKSAKSKSGKGKAGKANVETPIMLHPR